MKSQSEYDVIVIGAGPAGSTASAILADYGHKVLTIEKDKFPRYHIGESLMPYCYFPLERIGVIDKIKNSNFPKKYSVQFASLNGKISQPFYFFQHFDHEASTTWQVVRSEFDMMLMENAKAKGVTVLEETKVKELIKDERGFTVGVRSVDKDGKAEEYYAPMTIDASGRDALTMARSKWRVTDPELNKIALWTYYRGAKRDPGLDEGSTTVAFLPEKGWFWYIPLPNDIVSVGVVGEKDYLYRDTRDPAEIMKREAMNNPWITEHLATGEQFGEYWATGEYSYRSRYSAADGIVLAGDAYAFLDPVFSSGVFLALKSGELAADAVHNALVTGDVSARSFTEYSEQMCYGLETMRKVVYAFYDHEFSFRELFTKHPTVHGDLTDCLTGNVFREFDTLFGAMNEFAKMPSPLSHGRPLIGEPAEMLASV